jgi:hypothetical protein
MPRPPRLHRTLLAGLCLLAGCALAQERVGENELKAAYVFNFIQFVEWPQGDGRAGAEWTICVSPFSPLKRSLMALEGRPARKDNAIRIRLWEEANELGDCRVLVLDGVADTERALKALRDTPGRKAVLTIADGAASPPPDIMIALFREGNRIVFDINADAIGRSGLTVSSRLLRLSRGAR